MFANKMPKNDSLMMLIEKLTSLMLQIRVGAVGSNWIHFCSFNFQTMNPLLSGSAVAQW